jgi:hypothetical protein
MTSISHAERASIQTVLAALHDGFGKNLISIDQTFLPYLDKIDLQSRMISESKSQLLNDHCSGPVQKKICEELFDEIFSDFSLAMYFCAGGLIVPSQMSTRRAFELGLAAIYLWDLPHAFWGWRNRDDDLSFSAMVAHLNSTGYLEYLKQIHNFSDVTTICKQADFQKIYRELSNTVHGKTSNLPPLSPARFSLEDSQPFVIKQFALIEQAQSSILRLIFGRFPNLEEAIHEAMPQVKRK